MSAASDPFTLPPGESRDENALPSDRRIGVLLAAGRGTRMGRTKQLVNWPTRDGGKPLIAAAYDSIRPICYEIVVVLGHEAGAVAAALGDRQFIRVESDPDAPMFDSIRAGINAAQKIDPTASIVLQPGDHPEVVRPTLIALLDWSLQRPGVAVIPEYGGRGGHPVVIPARIATELIGSECPAGLAQFWTDHPDLCQRVLVDDPGVVRDIDVPADLDQ